MPDLDAYAEHSCFSDPGAYAGLVDAVPTDLAELSAVARNTTIHYRVHMDELPEATCPDIDARWLSSRLRIDQERHHGKPLAEPREPAARVQGCCRDFTLFCVGVLRQHGIPARSRIGFAPYFGDGWYFDHVIPEYWDGGHWHVFDSEVAHRTDLPGGVDPLDVHLGSDFITASQAWHAYRNGEDDLSTFGVAPDLPYLSGPTFVRNYVVYELAHRFGDELLLWDVWGVITDDGDPSPLIDTVAELLLRADAGDSGAETQAHDLYRSDPRLNPNGTVLRYSPFDAPPVEESLDRPDIGPCGRHPEG